MKRGLIIGIGALVVILLVIIFGNWSGTGEVVKMVPSTAVSSFVGVDSESLFDRVWPVVKSGNETNETHQICSGDSCIIIEGVGIDECSNDLQCSSNLTCVDNDQDGYNVTGGNCGVIDCDDNRGNVFPGHADICDGLDNDCDVGTVDGNAECSGDTPICYAPIPGNLGDCIGSNETNSTCVDSDGGWNIWDKGTLTGVYLTNGENPGDYCVTYSESGKGLVEYVCNEDRPLGFSSGSVDCEFGCFDGRCISANETCTAGWDCYNSDSRAYVGENCIWNNFEVCPDGCLEGACILGNKTTCSDTDGGRNDYVRGTLLYNGNEYTDYCVEGGDYDGWLYEFFCSDGVLSMSMHGCEDGLTCSDGACVSPMNQTNRTCEDSDGGKRKYTPGSVTVCDLYENGGACGNAPDFCIDPNSVKEMYCTGDNNLASKELSCSEGCEGGKCNAVSNWVKFRETVSAFFGGGDRG